ncbi:MAG TPA: HAD family acid phosphatase [Bryobacteraceae bacterium]|nr:HAD family acid phosphatase [Bryobacteraceae bacterium]
MRIRTTALLFCAACAWAQPQSHENLNAVAWFQTSAEYAASARQTYAGATKSLKRALADKNWTAAIEQTGAFAELPPAVILDLDETVLDNSAYEVAMLRANAPFSDVTWSRWVAEARAGTVPAAVRFLTNARAAGVALFYVTNRVCKADDASDPTVRVLRALNVPLEPGRLMCKGEVSDKSPRRESVARTHRILLLVGDDLGDFVSLPKDRLTVEGRAAAVSAYED